MDAVQVLFTHRPVYQAAWQSGDIFPLIAYSSASRSEADRVAFQLYRIYTDSRFIIQWTIWLAQPRQPTAIQQLREAGVPWSYIAAEYPLTVIDLIQHAMYISRNLLFLRCNPNLSVDAVAYLQTSHRLRTLSWVYYRGLTQQTFTDSNYPSDLRYHVDTSMISSVTKIADEFVRAIPRFMRQYPHKNITSLAFLSRAQMNDLMDAVTTTHRLPVRLFITNPGFRLRELKHHLAGRQLQLGYLRIVAANCDDNVADMLDYGCPPEFMLTNPFIDAAEFIRAIDHRHQLHLLVRAVAVNNFRPTLAMAMELKKFIYSISWKALVGASKITFPLPQIMECDRGGVLAPFVIVDDEIQRHAIARSANILMSMRQ